MSAGSTCTKIYPKLYMLARVELQLHSLNASGAIGNYTKLQEGYVVVDGEAIPVPVITGNALNNWHARAMVLKYLELGGTAVHKEQSVHQSIESSGLTCGTAVHKEHYEKGMQRVSADLAKASGITDKTDRTDAEKILVNGCSICDVHGFMLAEEGLPQVRRESTIKMSFAVPVEKMVKEIRKFVITHNRVSKDPNEMMVIKREYASAIYGWLSVFDLSGVGRSQYKKHPNAGVWAGEKIIEFDEVTKRVKAAILAYEALLTGELGASTSRALPLSKPVEIVAILTMWPIPMPLHPFYDDYVSWLKNILEKYGKQIEKVYYYGIDLKDLKINSGNKEGSKEGNKKVEPKEPTEILKVLAGDAKQLLQKFWGNLGDTKQQEQKG